MSSKGWKKMSQEEFDRIKKLFALGLNGITIAEITDRSMATVSYIKHSDSYDEYRQRITDMFEDNEEEEGEKAPEPTVVQITEVREDSHNDQLIAVLQHIASTLDKLEEHWREPAKKKTFFV